MTETYGLQPPWDADQSALNAAEIMAESKADSGKFRELAEHRMTCECTPSRKVIARVFAGADKNGVMRAWLWVPAVKAGRDRPASPPLSAPIPQLAGEPITPLTAICPRCKSGKLLLPGAQGPGTFDVIAIGAPTRGTVGG